MSIIATGDTPFHLAVLGQHLGVLELLGGHDGVLVHTHDNNNRSILLTAVDPNFVEGFRYLLKDQHLDPNCTDPDDDDDTPLTLALDDGIVEIVQLLVKDSRTWLFYEDDKGKSAMDHAIKPYNSMLVEMLQDAMHDRWSPETKMIAKVSAWPKLLESGTAQVTPCLLDLGAPPSQWLMGFLEKEGIEPWDSVSAEHWEWARKFYKDDILDRLEEYAEGYIQPTKYNDFLNSE